MKLNRKDIIKSYPWLNEKKQKFIISADYNGMICASFLNHFLNWELHGYYNFNSLWISNNMINNIDKIIWVDINVLPKKGRAIGGHIISINNQWPKGFKSSCNPNIFAKLDELNFHSKYPFSTLIFLLWLHNVNIEKTLMAKMLVLHSDDTWLKFQNYTDNIQRWMDRMPEYNWNWLFNKIDTINFEKRVDQILYPDLSKIDAISKKGKLISKKLNIKSKQLQFNPDWDLDVILNLFKFFGTHLSWTPPELPQNLVRIDGKRERVDLYRIKEIGLSKFLSNKKVFSYAIPSPRKFDYTSFKKI